VQPRKLILDMDNAFSLPVADTDDGLALALALASPEIELLGCTTCAGNCFSSQAAENTLRMLQLAGRTDIPVAQGRDRPLSADRRAHFDYLQAKAEGPDRSYWAGLPPPPALRIGASQLLAHEWIIQAVKAHPGQVTIVALGALTNLALALLRAPQIGSMIQEVIHMGGSFVPSKAGDPPPDWVTPDIPDLIWRNVLRFNTLFDPEASAVVFTAGLPLTLIPVNVTQHVFQRPEDLAALERSADPFHGHVAAYARPWVQWSMAVRRLPGAHLHDPLTLAVVIDRSLCRFRSFHIDVLKFLAGGFPWLCDRTLPPQAQVAVGVDAMRFERLFADRLAWPVQRPVQR
jgi:inosine-uridine nucleoside N-ribohydrolase